MEKIETLQEFYKRKFNWIPETIRSEFGHFNVFKFNPHIGFSNRPIPYKKRDYFKVVLMIGRGKIHLADQVIEVKKQALIFSNPLIRSKWEQADQAYQGFFCVFNQDFLHPFKIQHHYSVFQPKGTHVFELTNDHLKKVEAIFERMFEEINSEYLYKYDVLRNHVMELVHLAMKMEPSANFDAHPVNASQRITALFLDLLERQFPLDDAHQGLRLRLPSDFANHLNVHPNSLNRSVKETMLKTTGQVIAERILQEAKILLKHSRMSVSEIALALGFTAITNFNNFFKKHMKTSPLKFRSVESDTIDRSALDHRAEVRR